MRATSTTKAKVYNMYALPRKGYCVPHLILSLEETREKLETLVQTPHENISRNMSSFPTKLLHIPKICQAYALNANGRDNDKKKQWYTGQTSNRKMRPQRHQQSQWGRYKGGPLPRPIYDIPNYRALSLLQHLDKLGMEITLNTPALTPESIPLTHCIIDHIDNITTDQQSQLKDIGIAQIHD